MAAFDKVKSGIPQMDPILDYIRMGDNVVWQVSSIEEFKLFALPFVAQPSSVRSADWSSVPCGRRWAAT